MDDLVRNHGLEAKELPEAAVAQPREETAKVLDAAIARDAVTKRVHDS